MSKTWASSHVFIVLLSQTDEHCATWVNPCASLAHFSIMSILVSK